MKTKSIPAKHTSRSLIEFLSQFEVVNLLTVVMSWTYQNSLFITYYSYLLTM